MRSCLFPAQCLDNIYHDDLAHQLHITGKRDRKPLPQQCLPARSSLHGQQAAAAVSEPS